MSEEASPAVGATSTGQRKRPDAGARAEDRANRCAACDECAAKRENVTAGSPSWDNIPFLEDPAEINNYPGREDTRERHQADLNDVLATYQIPGRELRIRCSLKGAHRHNTGLVVRTLCGKVLCMGEYCGEDSIIGFKHVVRHANARRQFHVDLKLLEGWDQRALRELVRLDRRVRALDNILAEILSGLPTVFAKLGERAGTGASGQEVILDRVPDSDLPAELRRGPTRNGRLTGLQLFQQHDSCESLMGYIDLFRRARDTAPPEDGPTAKRLRHIVRAFDQKFDRLKAWADGASTFFGEENLRLVMVLLESRSPTLRLVATGWELTLSRPAESATIRRPARDLDPNSV